MSTQQIIWMTSAYAAALIAIVYFTRPVLRRFLGALAGGAAAGLLLMEIVALGEMIGWWQWHFKGSSTAFMILLVAGCTVPWVPVFMVTWRVARRFGWRGLALFLGLAGVVGPPRDYLVAMHFTEWGGFASGCAPVIADAMAYVVCVTAGHAVMRIIAGPAKADPLARTPPPPAQKE